MKRYRSPLQHVIQRNYEKTQDQIRQLIKELPKTDMECIRKKTLLHLFEYCNCIFHTHKTYFLSVAMFVKDNLRLLKWSGYQQVPNI